MEILKNYEKFTKCLSLWKCAHGGKTYCEENSSLWMYVQFSIRSLHRRSFLIRGGAVSESQTIHCQDWWSLSSQLCFFQVYDLIPCMIEHIRNILYDAIISTEKVKDLLESTLYEGLNLSKWIWNFKWRLSFGYFLKEEKSYDVLSHCLMAQ